MKTIFRIAFIALFYLGVLSFSTSHANTKMQELGLIETQTPKTVDSSGYCEIELFFNATLKDKTLNIYSVDLNEKYDECKYQ